MAENLRTSRVEKREVWYTFTAAFLKNDQVSNGGNSTYKTAMRKSDGTTSFYLVTEVRDITKNPKSYGVYR